MAPPLKYSGWFAPSGRRSLFPAMLTGLIFISFESFSQCADTVNFHDWLEPFHLEDNWQVDSATSVTQITEIFPPTPTFFVSEQDYINVKVSFDVVSNHPGDNDFIGLVLGFRNPFQPGSEQYEFVLLDWKAKKETAMGGLAEEGLTLSAIHGNIPPVLIPSYFWDHYGLLGNGIMEPLAHTFGENKGWEHGRIYHVDVWYTTALVIVNIDGIRVLEANNCNQSGRIGFYTYSQFLVNYRNLVISQAADLLVEPVEVCAGEPITASIEDTLCGGHNPAMTGWSWDWGDGHIDQNQLTGDHVYLQPGTYTLTMTANFSNGCTDTLQRKVRIKGNPPADLGPDTLIPIYSSVTLTAGPGTFGWSYLWSNGTSLPTLTLSNLDHDTLVWVWVSRNDCETYDEIWISVFEEVIPDDLLWLPNAFTPNDDGKNDEFKPVLQQELTGDYILYIYNRWGTGIFTSKDPGKGWDGKMKGQECPEDVYVYLVRYLYSINPQDIIEETWRGNVMLLR
jgi:gliding motility-associated-like protein